MPKNRTKTKRLTPEEAREADARMEHFLRCLRYQRIYEAAVRFRERRERKTSDDANRSAREV